MVLGSGNGQTEVVNVENDLIETCSGFPNVSREYSLRATGDIFDDGTIIICGGDDGKDVVLSCSLIKSGTVIRINNLHAMTRSASVVFEPDTLYVTGGYWSPSYL